MDCQAPLFMRFPRQEYCSGLPYLPPGDLLNIRIEPVSPVAPALQVDSLPTEPPGKQDDDCSHGIKSLLLLGRNAMTNLDSILKNKDITLPTKVHTVKGMIFLLVIVSVRAGP